MKQIKDFYCRVFSQENIDKVISGGSKGQIALLSLAIITGLILFSAIVILVNVHLGKEEDWYEQLWVVYNNFVDPGNQRAEEGWSNRLTVIFISLFGSITLGGLLISTISNIIERRVDAIRTGKVVYKNISDHYVIIGFNEITVSIIKELYKEIAKENNTKKKASGYRILIMSSQEAESVSHTLQSQLDKEEEKIIKIYFGNIESEEELRTLNIDRAREVYILGEADEYGRDSKNIGCVAKVSKLRGKPTSNFPMPVYVQFDRISSYSNIQKLTLPPKDFCYNENGKLMPNIYFRPFNFHENWARQLWSLYTIPKAEDQGQNLCYEPLDYRPIRIEKGDNGIYTVNSQDFVHLVIVGFSKMGRALLLEALRVCHYANYDDSQPEDKRIRTLITLIDKDMDTMKNYFTSQFPYLNQIDDIQIDYRTGDICTPDIRQELEEWSKDKKRMLTIAICVSDPDISLSLGLNLPAIIYESETRILIRQEIQTNLSKLIDEDKGKFRYVKIFGMLNQGIQKDMLQDELASYVHQYYKCEYCSDKEKDKKDCYMKYGCKFHPSAGNKNTYLSNLYRFKFIETDKDFYVLQKLAYDSWNELREIDRWSNRYQLDAYLLYCRTLGYAIVQKKESDHNARFIQIFNGNTHPKQITDEQMQILIRMEKHRWNAERSIEGWRYGLKRDNIHLIHPLIVPFHQVPEPEKLKDKDVITNIPYILAFGNYCLIEKSYEYKNYEYQSSTKDT